MRVFYGILVYGFHSVFNCGFWDVQCKLECLRNLCIKFTRCVYNEFGNLWCMFLLDSHLSMYVKLSLATWVSLFLCSLLMKLCRFRMEPSCVVDGTLVSQYGFECAMCIGGFLCL